MATKKLGPNEFLYLNPDRVISGTVRLGQPLTLGTVGSPTPQQLESLIRDIETGGQVEVTYLVMTSQNLDDNVGKPGYPNAIQRGVGLTPLNFTIKPTVGLNVSPVLGNPIVVQTDSQQGAVFSTSKRELASLTFTFAPGVSQLLNYSQTTGVDVTSSVTEGISKGTSQSSTITSEVAASLGGSFLGFGVEASLEKSWADSWGTSQTIDFSSTTQKTISKSTTVAASVDFANIKPDFFGKYFYGTTELVPGNRYKVIVTEGADKVTAPIQALFNIAAQGLTTTVGTVSKIPDGYKGFGFTGSGRPPVDGTTEVDAAKIATDFIYDAIYKYNYDAIYGGDLSTRQWTKTLNPNGLQVLAQSKAEFSGSYDLTIELKQIVAVPDLLQSNGNDSSPTRNISLDTYNVAGSGPGVALDLSSTQAPSNYSYNVTGSTGGYDYVTLGDHLNTLVNFRNSKIEVKGGYNCFDDQLGQGGNTFYIKGGMSTLKIRGPQTYVDVQGGRALIEDKSSGALYVDSGAGPIIFKITESGGNTVVTNWDNRKDVLQFGDNIDLPNVAVKYDEGMRCYQVLINNSLAATLEVMDGALPAYDPVTGLYEATKVRPFVYTGSDVKFLSTLYGAAFDRLPDSDGLAYWLSALDSRVSRSSVASSIFSSKEFESTYSANGQFAAALYRDLLGRTPDADGLNYWTKQLDGGASRFDVAQSFIGSGEFAGLFA